MKNQKDTDQMEEAYKQLDGAPSMTGVSDAAKGESPQNDDKQHQVDTEEKNERLYGEDDAEIDPGCADIEHAYAMLFGGMAELMKAVSSIKSGK